MIVLYVCYWLAVLGLMTHGLNCYWLVLEFRRHRERKLAELERTRRDYWSHPQAAHPRVTVQIPVYNERSVVGRVLHAVGQLRYPADRLQIQILDDSTDDTTEIIADLVPEIRARGIDVQHIRREHRTGFKAGALKEGMRTATGELIAIFDADFVPQPELLALCIPFFDREGIGLVQCRWGHINPGYSWLTATQSIAIDGHFGIEQAARCWGGYFLNFNGTAGIWHRQAIEDAGGWLADTLTEDLDLSYRAQLAGWKVEYLFDVEVPSEIPVSISAFKSQQRRWAKGSIQVALKLLPRVWRADLSLKVKLQASLHLTHYSVHPLMLMVALLSVPLLIYWHYAASPLPFVISVIALVIASAGPSWLYVSAQRALRRDWWRKLARIPFLMVLGTGIAISNTRAVLEALLGVQSPFVRTPKYNATARARGTSGGYKVPLTTAVALEFIVGIYCLVGLWLYLGAHKYLVGPYLALYAAGFLVVGFVSLSEFLVITLRSEIPEREPESTPIEYELALHNWREDADRLWLSVSRCPRIGTERAPSKRLPS